MTDIQKQGYEGLTMSRYGKLVLILPDEAAARLKEVAAQESQTVAAFVANVVDDWLERRRSDVRLGRTRQREALQQVETGTNTGKRR
jgi:hypothetical protein